MKKFYLLTFLLLLQVLIYAQQNIVAQNPEVFTGRLIRVADPFHPDPNFHARVVRNEQGIIGRPEKEYEPPIPFPQLQQPTDGALQANFPEGNKPNTITTIEGMGYTSVCPADPTMAVGPSYIVQMINAASGAVFQVWDKSGNILLSQKLLSDITGTQGLGDCIAFMTSWPIALFSLNCRIMLTVLLLLSPQQVIQEALITVMYFQQEAHPRITQNILFGIMLIMQKQMI